MMTKILILGATGMLGNTLLCDLSRRDGFEVHATARNRAGLERWFSPEQLERINVPVDVGDFDSVVRVLAEVRPDVVINCIGVIKQLAGAKDSLMCIKINALFPHCLAKACERIGARLIHISTDCVFSGKKGGYVESDFPDCDDLYGRTKLLGEVDYPHAVTLRTSIIGHELNSCVSLIDWFLAQEGRVRGYTRAIYSGFPTVEMARIIAEIVIPRPGLSGLYQVSSEPISKYDLLCLVRERYGKKIEIDPDYEFFCDRSLDSSKFFAATGYVPPAWPELVEMMHREWKRFEAKRVVNY
ncbi:MAG: SDR family oxidoreductase [Desulfuromonadaceae bacterium]